MPPRNIWGPPVRGEDCFARGPFVELLEQRLRDGCVLLSAPRRWGKSSVLRMLVDRDPASRHYFDLYPCESAAAFVAEIAVSAAIGKVRIAQWVADTLGRPLDQIKSVKIGEIAFELRDRLRDATDWQRAGSRIFAQLPASHILVFDEFPVLVKSILDRDPKEAGALLRWLRTERQRDGAPRLVLAGSTSLPELCRQAGFSDTINDLILLPLPRLDRPAAKLLLRSVLETEGVKVVDETVGAAVDLVGPEVPFFLQLMAAAIIAEVRDTLPAPPTRRVSPTLVRRLYETVLLSPLYRPYLDDYRGRLDRSYLPAELDLACLLLNSLSQHRDGLELFALRNEAVAKGLGVDHLDRVLALLEGDFYVVREDGGGYRFFNRYLADWWQRFHA